MTSEVALDRLLRHDEATADLVPQHALDDAVG
jgi:hypothetical protein